ncbi:DUF4303 domain-containing protein [Paenibacillus sp. FSL R5-0766]|uniref:DUF4303 domain-containing protein n=1 Tax=unclassified Paenibacillus TaxID=185978 RepID=UPI00096F913E|nr:DUF4303 domain-containing protein [Paenibacillus sp. FSL R5-0765]OMF65042.1 hypothetical protein BK141_12035 [Paenibacillus sp. FSL R5-0765]
MDLVLNEFEDHFRASFLPDLEQTLSKVQDEKVYACAFGTDSDWVTLFMALNTEESLSKHITNMKEQGLCDSEQDEIYYRWGCSEYQYGEDTHFNHISRLLYGTEEVQKHKDEIIRIIAKVVNETVDDVFARYGQTKADITFFVSLTDDDLAEEIENQSVHQMTVSSLASKFLKRYDGIN